MQQDLPAAGEPSQREEVKSLSVSSGGDRDDAFWLSHDERRLSQGMSVRQYSHDNALPLSTYRYRLAKHRRSTGDVGAETERQSGTSFIAIGGTTGSSSASDVEVTLATGLTLRLTGASAERVLARVLERLA